MNFCEIEDYSNFEVSVLFVFGGYRRWKILWVVALIYMRLHLWKTETVPRWASQTNKKSMAAGLSFECM